MDDLNDVIQNGSLPKEKKIFLQEHKREFLSYLHFMTAAKGIATLKPAPKDAEFIYITGVIKRHNAGQSITSTSKNQNVDPAKMEMEKTLFESHVLYVFYQQVRKPGFIEQLCDEEISFWYNNACKK